MKKKAVISLLLPIILLSLLGFLGFIKQYTEEKKLFSDSVEAIERASEGKGIAHDYEFTIQVGNYSNTYRYDTEDGNWVKMKKSILESAISNSERLTPIEIAIGWLLFTAVSLGIIYILSVVLLSKSHMGYMIAVLLVTTCLNIFGVCLFGVSFFKTTHFILIWFFAIFLDLIRKEDEEENVETRQDELPMTMTYEIKIPQYQLSSDLDNATIQIKVPTGTKIIVVEED